MDSLISKNITYTGLKAVFNGDERKVIDTIKDIKDNSLKFKLEKEAAQYWAKFFNTTPSNIYYGDINDDNVLFFLDNGRFMKEYIIGKANFEYCYNLFFLKGVVGELMCPNITNLPELEFVTETLNLGNYKDEKKKEAYLPKLKKCKYINLAGLKITSLGLKSAEHINLARTEINKIKIKQAYTLVLNSSSVKDISSLEKVDILHIEDVDCSKIKINSKLIINSRLETSLQNSEIMNKYLKENTTTNKKNF